MTGDILNKIYIESGLTGVVFAKLLGIGRTKLYGLFNNAVLPEEIIELIDLNEQLKILSIQIIKEDNSAKKQQTINPNALQDAHLLVKIDSLKYKINTLEKEIIALTATNFALESQNNKLLELLTKKTK